MKKVSIITPCYNGERYLERFFRCILMQTYKNIELILVNDGSTDGTWGTCLEWECIFKDNNIEFIHIEKENGGAASAINEGLKHFTGDYLIWPDCDDLLSVDSIDNRVEFLEKNPQYGFVRSDASVVNENDIYTPIGTISKKKQNRFDENIFDALILETTFCSSGCYMARREALIEAIPNLFLYESKAGQNWQLLLPLASKFPVGFIDECLYTIVVDPHSQSRLPIKQGYEAILQQLIGYEDVMQKTIEYLDIDVEKYKQIVKRKYAYRRFKLAIEYSKKDACKIEYKQLRELGINTLNINILLILCGKPKAVKMYDFLKKRF